MPSPPEPLRFYAELYVARPPSVVWSFFSDLTRWNQWSPICLESRLVEDGRLETGAVLQIRFSIGGIPVTVPAKLVDVRPHSAISWLGQAFGIKARHTYRFRAQNTGTLITNEEVFYEVARPFNHLIPVWYRISRLSLASLQGIKRALEQETESADQQQA